MKLILLLFFVIISSSYSWAQTTEVWSVDRCMSYAVENSYATARAVRNLAIAKENYTAAIGRHLPQIGASVGASANFGRGIDPATNTYINTTTFNNGYSLGVNIPVFNALELLNTTLMNKVAVARNRSEVQKAADDVALSVMRYFIEVQYAKGLVELTEQRVNTFQADLNLATRRSELGTKSEADVAQFAASLATEQVALVTRQNEYEVALLNLKNVMNFPIDDTLQTADDLVPEMRLDRSAGDIFEAATDYLPAIEVLRKRLKEQKYELSVARSVYYPSISVSGGVSTNYFSVLDGAPSARTANFGSQFTNNLGQYAQASLSVPIFNGMSARTHVRKAKIAYDQAQSDYNEKMRSLRIEIEQAVMDLRSAQIKQMSAKRAVEANFIAYRAVEAKYRQGMVSVIELQTSSNQLLGSQIELLWATLTLEVKDRQVGYFSGEALFN